MPGLTPEFRAGARDYTVPSCDDALPLRVRAGADVRSRIGEAPWQTRGAVREIDLDPGQAVRVVRRWQGDRRAYFIRCLPADFPRFTFTRWSRAIDELMVITPTTGNYAIVVDGRGVPVWWLATDTPIIDAKVLPNGLIAYVRWYGGAGFATDSRTAYEIRTPSGALVDEVALPGGVVTDHHDLEVTPSGNYVLISYQEREATVDASEYNGDPDARVIDGVIQETTPEGEVVWSWRSSDHISLAETGRWWQSLAEPYNLVHLNSVEALANGDFLISSRHTDAVYRIDRESGGVEWKIGGVERPESLRLENDPAAQYPLGGQHDVRATGSGTVSVYDNATFLGRPPRAVRYRVDPGGRSATLIDSVESSNAPRSQCCGSARYDDGNWIVSWGGLPVVESFTGGERDFALWFENGFSYRANPVDGATEVEALRHGMNRRVSPVK